jgi:hypothetical protein
MHPEDRVLVAVMNRPKDFEIARDEGWYRIPEGRAPRGMFFEYVAFYFTGAFGDRKWAVHYYARILGHELVTRRNLLPDEADHPRAGELYYKLQLGPLQQREPPIVSRRWRRIAFIHTTWDRFEAAQEINDLFVEGGEFVDRLYHALREVGMAAERRYPVRDAGIEYIVDLALPCREGVLAVDIVDRESGLPGSLRFTMEQIGDDPTGCLETIRAEIHWRGGMLPQPQERAEDSQG